MTSFQDLGIQEDLLKGIIALGFDTPTPVQQLVIPAALQAENDLIALAQTGTGKTAAFGLPLLQNIDPDVQQVQALVLCPTRELCVQVATDLERYAQFARQYKIVAVYGGASITEQMRLIKGGAQIVVATPGRLIDLIDRKAAKLSGVKCVVLDEADEMLNMGFREAIETILSAAENRESTWLFSATMPPEVRAIARNYMKEPRELSAGTPNTGNANIEHIYYVCRNEHRYAALKRVVDANPGIYSLIFCRTKNETKEIAEQMIRDGYDAEALHGDLAQADRDRVMQRFRERNLQLLVATDVAARGIDVSEISHVINYGLPDEPEVYTHRSGRTGRAGHTGVSISIITSKFEEKIHQIERRAKTVFRKEKLPTGADVCERQLFHIIKAIHNQEVKQADIEPYMPAIYEELKDLTKEELIKRFASVELNRFLAYYRNAPDINPPERGERRKVSPAAHADGSQVRLFVNIGSMDGVSKSEFLQLLQEGAGVPRQAVGQIDLRKTHTHFDVDAAYLNAIKRELPAFNLNGRRLRVDDAAPEGEGKPAKRGYGGNKPFQKSGYKGGRR
ncbi:MAG: DEAD/DEAH box helicase [Saprospiraceae bacterium]|nr:DEAD/DEAH box helicase [Saprospiraceae bacterium]